MKQPEPDHQTPPREVSCRNLDANVKVLADLRIDRDRWKPGPHLTREYLQTKSNWISWGHYVELMRGFCSLVGADAPKLTAEAYMTSSDASRFIRFAAGLLVDPYWLYWIGIKVGGPSVWPTIRGEITPIDRRRFRAVITIPDAHEDCPYYLDTCFHCWMRFPALLGCDAPEIEYQRATRRATFEVTLPRSRAVLPRALGSLMSLVTPHPVSPDRAKGRIDELESRLGDVNAGYSAIEEICADMRDPLPEAERDPIEPSEAESHLVQAQYHAEMARLATATLDDLDEDYRRELQSRFDKIKARNPRFSMRAFAQKIGLSPTTMVNVMSGKRNLSGKAAIVVAQRLGFSEAETRRFCRLVQLSNIADPSVRSVFGYSRKKTKRAPE